jgi:hypothetical protein
MTRNEVQEYLHQMTSGRIRAYEADEPQPSNERYYERQEALSRLALANLDTQAWLTKALASAESGRRVKSVTRGALERLRAVAGTRETP